MENMVRQNKKKRE